MLDNTTFIDYNLFVVKITTKLKEFKMLQRAFDKAKKGEDKKVSINFQVPSMLKEEFERLCKESGVSVTAMLNSLIEVAIEEHQGISIDGHSTLQLIEELRKAEVDLQEAQTMIDNGDSYIDFAKDAHGNDVTIDFEEIKTSAKMKIGAIRAELQKRGSK